MSKKDTAVERANARKTDAVGVVANRIQKELAENERRAL